MHWSEVVAAARLRNEPVVLVTVLAVRGHAPRGPGAKLVVGVGQTWGSIGGGNLEQSAVVTARRALAGDTVEATCWTVECALSPHAQTRFGRQCCGGSVTLAYEVLPARPTVAIFGAGHVGSELARVLGGLDVRLVLVDSRADRLTPERVRELTGPTATLDPRHRVLPESVLPDLPDGSHLLVMTHDHAEDHAILDAALRAADGRENRWGSVGLIGSAGKWARFRRLLGEAGHSAGAVGSITCPIGSPEITGKEPAVIALSVAAELLARLASAPAETIRSGSPAADLGEFR